MKLKGIVIHTVEHGEHNLLVTIYTRELGKITAVAKSASKASSKQASHLDIFNIIDFSLIEGNGHPIIASALSHKTYPGIKKSLPALACGLFVMEIMNNMTYSHDPDRYLWQILEKALEGINDKADKLGAKEMSYLVSTLESVFLKAFGYSKEGVSPQAILEQVSGKKLSSLRFIRQISSQEI